MSAKIRPGSANVVRSPRALGPGRKYLKFQLEPKTLREVEALARQAGCTPFAMCVRLLEEELARRAKAA
jgi:hypothetical protein